MTFCVSLGSPAWKLKMPVEKIADMKVAGRKKSVTTAMVFIDKLSFWEIRLYSTNVKLCTTACVIVACLR